MDLEESAWRSCRCTDTDVISRTTVRLLPRTLEGPHTHTHIDHRSLCCRSPWASMSADDLQQERRACLARARSIPGHAVRVIASSLIILSQKHKEIKLMHKRPLNKQVSCKQLGCERALSAVPRSHVDTNADRNTHAAQAGNSNQLILMLH